MPLLPNEFNEESAMLIQRRHFKAAMQSIADKRCATPRPTPVSANNSGVGVICIYGLLMPTVPDWYKEWGFDATGYDEIAAKAIVLKDDPSCLSVSLLVDSGGGYVKGLDAAELALRELAAAKPVTAIVDGMSASAAYWLTSQASSIQASPMSEVGGIGVYSTIYDYTGYMSQLGIRPIVIRSAPNKGMGEDEVTEEQLAAQQSIVDGIHAMFVQSVARGRSVSTELIESVATGQTYLAADALKSRLIDSITNSPTVGINTNSTTEGPHMTDETTETSTPVEEPVMPDPADTPPDDGGDTESAESSEMGADDLARVDALLDVFADDIAFAREAIKNKWSVDQAKAAHYDALKAQFTGAANGTTPIPPSRRAESGSFRSWDEAYKLLKSQGMTDVEAATAVTERFPHLG